LRYLTFTTLALPGLLVTHWLLDRYALMPDETGLLDMAAALLAISFALLLGVVPFHTWVPAVAGGEMPLGGSFVLTVANGTVWFLLLDFLQTYPGFSAHPRFGPVVMGMGLAMVLLGGGLALAQRRLGPLLGYAALVDNGAALIALGTKGRLGLTLVLLSLLVRPFGLVLMAAGLSGLRTYNGGDDRFDALRGLGWKAPWSTAGLIFGALSIAGLPVSAGFAWRWSLCRALSSSNPGSVLLLLLAGAGVIVGVWRALFVLLARPRSPKDRSVLSREGSTEGWLTAVVVSTAILGCIGVGLFPQTIAPLAVSLAEAYTFFGP
jgi:NADH-quinone oxidoreductase subunit N